MNDPIIILDDGDAVRASTIVRVRYEPETGLATRKRLARVHVDVADFTWEFTFRNNKEAMAERARIIKIIQEAEAGEQTQP